MNVPKKDIKRGNILSQHLNLLLQDVVKLKAHWIDLKVISTK